jgi:hypothetical protein
MQCGCSILALRRLQGEGILDLGLPSSVQNRPAEGTFRHRITCGETSIPSAEPASVRVARLFAAAVGLVDSRRQGHRLSMVPSGWSEPGGVALDTAA